MNRRYFLLGGSAIALTAGYFALRPEGRPNVPRFGEGFPRPPTLPTLSESIQRPDLDDLFTVGTFDLHPVEHFDFQLNRAVCLGGAPAATMREIGTRIDTLEDWDREFVALRESAVAEGDLPRAATYARMAEFFMADTNPEKRRSIGKFLDYFQTIHAEAIASGEIVFDQVPYDGGAMKTAFLPAPTGSSKNRPIIMTLGFDAFIEEVYPIAEGFRRNGYPVYLFEGPGQGLTLHDHKIVMEPDWERPVGAVLDHFGLDDVTLFGLSLGGYLALRAAAHDNRVTGVVAFNIMYDFFKVLTQGAGQDAQATLESMIGWRLSPIVNRSLRTRMAESSYVQWGIEHGLFVFGVDTPYEYFRKAMDFNTHELSQDVRQHVLLTAGAEDHYIPIEMLGQQEEILVNVASLESRIFTVEENAAAHCQIGNLPLAIADICDWLDRLEGVQIA